MLSKMQMTKIKTPDTDDVAQSHATMPIDMLCSIMKANRLSTISKGVITTTDNNDLDKDNLLRRFQ